jgi:hypothetical protein
MLAHRATAGDVPPVDTAPGSTRWLPCPHARPLARWIAPALAILSLALGCYILVSTLGMVVQTWSALPFGDQWDMLIGDVDRLTFGWLYAQHNEHRLIFPKLIFAIDRFGFAETNRFNFFCNVFFAVSLAILTVYQVSRSAGLRSWDKLWSAGVAAGFLFSAMQWENFVWGFQVGFFGVVLAAFASFSVIASGAPTVGRVAAAVICESIAVFTLSCGVIVPVLAIPLAIWRRWKRGPVAVLAIAAVGLLASYLIGYVSPPGHSDPLQTLLQLPAVSLFVITEIGSPLAHLLMQFHVRKYLHWDQALGALGVVILLVAVVRLVRRRTDTSAAEAVFVATAAFVLGTAALTALGRLKFGLMQALAPRYTSLTLLFWLSLLLLALVALARRGPDWRVFLMAVSLPVLTALASAQSGFTALGGHWTAGRSDAVTALLADVYDPQSLERAYPPGGALPFERARSLREKHLSIFAAAWSGWRGTPLAEHVGLAPDGRCRGGIDEMSPIPTAAHPGSRARGWAWDNDRDAPPSHIVLVDGTGHVVGYALGGFAAPQPGTPEGSGWHGHFAAGQGSSITAYALLEDRTACPLQRAAAR